MGVKKHISETPLSKSNSVDLYRPPALRNNNSNNNNSSSEEAAAANESTTAINTTIIAAGTASTATTNPASKGSPNREQQADASAAATRRERRPDRAVYVPRARRSQTTPPTTTTTATTAVATTAAAAATATITAAESPPVADTNSSKADDANGQQLSKSKKSKPHRERRERGKKSTAISASPTADNATLLVISGTENDTQSNQENRPAKPADCDKEFNYSQTMSGAQRTKPGNGNKSTSNGKSQPSPPLRIEDVAAARTTNGEEAAKCDNDVRELQRASKEINRSNRRIMKQTFVSDVLEIPEKIDSAAPKAMQSPQASATAKPPADSTTEDDDEEDEDDWENMFDESGDCLDPKILQELSESVGKCKIELPKMDYTVFHIKQQLLNEEEFPHVLEVSNFPVEFKTPDLLMLFAQYKGSGFDIKWVDDTHALAVFSSSRIAAEVLTMGHPFVKLKPLAEATLESRLKAKKAGAVSLQPYRQRPETCTALARRLVSGALGVKLPTAPQERENERRVLREAKERKLLAAKQRDEVWES
ncbi:R3H and coiled-coil domain-containing protein 1 isoform X2 [Drosophila gunungcola]|uniref:R3H and coiled-coil domain-containing protein 1 isoform X2 n=1 Tax=Drosophila gunungcola TaxID=103775 RepID=UPI0022E2FE0E|nr:R3H and coiled-coil domain-containing protein 1 isoform X2 [Drosophila gunungcola]XP_052848089.1 R3H and coiled-coil domain-containing protein 1 isoform X2 [Drosophila gunungcola]